MENKETQPKWRVDDDGSIYAICPICESKIYGLEIILKAYVQYFATPNKTNGLECEEMKEETDWDDDYMFCCPECGKLIARSKDEAIKLFQE